MEAFHAAHALPEIRNADRIDLVFTDVHMPVEMNRHALAKWIKQHRPAYP